MPDFRIALRLVDDESSLGVGRSELARFDPVGGPVVNTSSAKVSGLVGINSGQLTLVGDIALGIQTPTGSPAVPAFAGPTTAANGSFGLSSGSVFVSGTFVGLSQPPLGAASGLNTGSCYGWDSGDSDPATSAAQVRVDLRVPYVGQRTDSGGTSAVRGSSSSPRVGGVAGRQSARPRAAREHRSPSKKLLPRRVCPCHRVQSVGGVAK